MPAATPFERSPDTAAPRDIDDDVLSRAAGQGTFVGLLAAALSHWAWGLNLPILAFLYGFGSTSLRSRSKLAAILTMIGATVLYFAIYDIIALESLGTA